MSVIFDWSVNFLEWLGLLLGMSHKAISVPLFVILVPGITLIQGILCLYLRWRLKQQEAWP